MSSAVIFGMSALTQSLSPKSMVRSLSFDFPQAMLLEDYLTTFPLRLAAVLNVAMPQKSADQLGGFKHWPCYYN
jgi:hypothetical protein